MPLARQHRRIEPSHGLIPIDFGELWRYRELLYRFLWRDFKARYKQTYLGPFWAVFRPFVSIVLFSVIFGSLAKISTGSKGVPYPLFALGLLPWTYFSSALTGSSGAILNSGGMLQKVYFPRIYAPLSAAVTPLIDFALTMVIAVMLFVYYQRLPSWHLVFMPVFILLALVAGLGLGLWFTGIMVRYRDAVVRAAVHDPDRHVRDSGRLSGVVYSRTVPLAACHQSADRGDRGLPLVAPRYDAAEHRGGSRRAPLSASSS